MAHSPVLYGISFDGVAVSGITAEFVKLAALFRRRGYTIHLDLGYDIKPDKGNFFRAYGRETSPIPEWVRLTRTVDFSDVRGYTPELVDAMRQETVPLLHAAGPEAMIRRIAARIVATFLCLEVTILVVENGTLPENVLYTRALYAAIAEYGRLRRLGAYVLWRDHDVMWFCEPQKYGTAPYRHVPRPRRSPYIRYAALTAPAAKSLSRWSGAPYAVLPNSFEFRERPRPRRLRETYGIPADAFLIARCTRVIPQKRIDREIRLLRAAGDLAASRAWTRTPHLFVTGSLDEHPGEAAALRALARSLGVERQVHFGNSLLPCDAPPQRGRFSVSDLLVESDLSSFLTSYRYEGFGNAPGEACAHRVPYVSSSYQLYDAVYGCLGLRALTMPLDGRDADPTAAWTAALVDRIMNERRLAADARFNFDRARGHLSTQSFAKRLARLFPHLLQDGMAQIIQPAVRRVHP